MGIPVDRYAAQKHFNPFCRHDYRNFLKFVGRFNRNYLTDGLSLSAPREGVTRGEEQFAGGNLPTLSHLRDFALGEAASTAGPGGKCLPAHPRPEHCAYHAMEPAGSVTPFVTIDWGGLVRIGKFKRF